MKKLLIIGAGGHGRVVADIAEELNIYEQICFLDDEAKPDLSYDVIGGVKDAEKFIGEFDFIVAIGSNSTRETWFNELLKKGASFATLIHPKASIGSNVEIGNGSVVMAGAVINNAAKIGNGVIVNTCSSVDHDCEIGDFVHIAVGAHIAGTVSIGEKCFVGAGVTVINNINVCANCIIGAGATVIKNIETAGIYVGTPAILKKQL